MPQIIFIPHEEICPEGAVFEVEPGITICDAALQMVLKLNMPAKNHVHVLHVMCMCVKVLVR